ncbi:hypothetical protein EJ02DRAFT_470135 [Clathrospora elynae]|uniref:Uncharacterized protein n=1 Tax=Clathrospora elynae TaxID=706981 RepID=A0A6A5SHG8_9PLEO|nr:hypothetical protein EJ02DRAFT_470135 [Clathrospora elynae]
MDVANYMGQRTGLIAASALPLQSPSSPASNFPTVDSTITSLDGITRTITFTVSNAQTAMVVNTFTISSSIAKRAQEILDDSLNNVVSNDCKITESSTEWETTTTVLDAQVTVHSTTTKVVPISQTATSEPDPTKKSNGGGLSKGAKAGIGGGVAVGALLHLGIRKRRKQRQLGDTWGKNAPIRNTIKTSEIAHSPRSFSVSSPAHSVNNFPALLYKPELDGSPNATLAQPAYTQHQASSPGACQAYSKELHGHVHQEYRGISPEFPASPVQRPQELHTTSEGYLPGYFR